MKLRNKKTGKIIPIEIHNIAGKNYNSLAEINEEWEDYEEPKDFWFIDDEGDVGVVSEEYEKHLNEMKSIGNYFNTQEEAEKSVEKLKAWKRLKDKGFRFKACDDYHIDYVFTGKCYWSDETEKDLDLLFGGEE